MACCKGIWFPVLQYLLHSPRRIRVSRPYFVLLVALMIRACLSILEDSLCNCLELFRVFYLAWFACRCCAVTWWNDDKAQTRMYQVCRCFLWVLLVKLCLHVVLFHVCFMQWCSRRFEKCTNEEWLFERCSAHAQMRSVPMNMPFGGILSQVGVQSELLKFSVCTAPSLAGTLLIWWSCHRRWLHSLHIFGLLRGISLTWLHWLFGHGCAIPCSCIFVYLLSLLSQTLDLFWYSWCLFWCWLFYSRQSSCDVFANILKWPVLQPKQKRYPAVWTRCIFRVVANVSIYLPSVRWTAHMSPFQGRAAAAIAVDILVEFWNDFSTKVCVWTRSLPIVLCEALFYMVYCWQMGGFIFYTGIYLLAAPLKVMCNPLRLPMHFMFCTLWYSIHFCFRRCGMKTCLWFVPRSDV